MSTYADKNGYCWPSMETMAKRLKRSQPWVTATVKRLQKKGIIEVSRKQGRKYGFKIKYDNHQPADINHQPADTNTTKNTTNRTSIYKNATQIKENFKPTPEMLAFLKDKRPDIDATKFTENFILTCKAKGHTYKRWDMAWQKWVLNERASHNAQTYQSKPPRPPLADIAESFKAAAELADNIIAGPNAQD